MPILLTSYQGPAGDRNDQGTPGALMTAKAIAALLGTSLTTVGTPARVLNTRWDIELQHAREDLLLLAEHLRAALGRREFPVTTLNRCAASIATLPVVASAHPEAAIVWFDAHADLNTPESSASGFLGGMALSGPAGMWDSGFGAALRLDQIVLVGARDMDPFEQGLIDAGKLRLVRADSADIGGSLRAAVGSRPAYVHLDCDVLEPGLVPTDFKVPGGLSFARLREAMTALSRLTVVGLEVAEFQARWESSGTLARPDELLFAIAPLLELAAVSVQAPPHASARRNHPSPARVPAAGRYSQPIQPS